MATDMVGGVKALVDELRARGIDIDASDRRLAEYSYDASNYRIEPLAVVFPRDIPEVRRVVETCARRGVPITPRGGGTSMAGNTVGRGVVVDLSRHFRSMGPVDISARSVTVDAGVVLGELRSHVETQTDGQFTFAPDPSSLSRATVGGSVANDACGNHSVKHGRMSHHLLTVELITADGAWIQAGPGTVAAADPTDTASVLAAERISRELRALSDRWMAEARLELGRIPRQVSGFHLEELLPERGFNVARALAGSEGTCAIVVRAVIRVVPRARHIGLVCLGYDDTVQSARDVPDILGLRPSAVEALDSSIVDIMRGRRGESSVESLPRGAAFLLVEFDAESEKDAEERCAQLVRALKETGRAVDYTVITDPTERAKLWRVREDGAGLSSRRLDGVQTWPGWEDSAVAPERLADYLSELLPLVERYGYSSYLYGHFGAGCVHMRLDCDFTSARGRSTWNDFIREAAELVASHGGSLSGEHGDGRARSELLGLMYSANMMRAFSEFKRIWDPQSILNPGVIVDPAPIIADLALQGATVRQLPGDAHACIGVGRCRSSAGHFMCPSYRATQDEKDSTRARARVLQEFARGAADVRSGWADPVVRDSLDLCLSCKACSTDCPTGVDIAEAKSELIDEHFRGRVRPFTHYSIGWLPRWIPLLSAASTIANSLTANAALRRLGELLGVSARRVLPSFVSRRVIRRSVREAAFADASADVVVFLDSFTKAFRPWAVPAAARVLKDAGMTVGCAEGACCGLTWISTGQRDAARRRLQGLVERLDDGTDRAIVVLEPSCAATIKQDAPRLVGGPAAARVADRVRTFAGMVDTAMEAGWEPSGHPPQRVALQVHCHENAAFGSNPQLRVLRRWGVERLAVSSSCCGVAGNFGFESEHFDMSMRVAQHSIVPALALSGPDSVVLADGFSCSMQVTQVDPSRRAEHLATLLDPERRDSDAGRARSDVESIR